MSGQAVNALLLLIGGARSGKSRLAQELADRAGGPVTFVATATAGDDDMASRIMRHQADRPSHWGLIECPIALEPALELVEPEATVILDCLTMWVANVLFDDAEHDIEAEAEALAVALARRSGPTIVVTNEVGMGVHPPTDLGRRYQDVLGRVNQIVAARAGRSLLLVAGRAIPLEHPATLLADWP